MGIVAPESPGLDWVRKSIAAAFLRKELRRKEADAKLVVHLEKQALRQELIRNYEEGREEREAIKKAKAEAHKAREIRAWETKMFSSWGLVNRPKDNPFK
jgi:transposase-like protein